MSPEVDFSGADHTPFAQIPDWVFAHPDVRSGSVLPTYIAMYLDANWKKRESVVDWRAIAARTGLSRATIFDNIRRMDRKVIVRRGRGRYWLPMDRPPKSEIPDYDLAPDLDSKSENLDSKSNPKSRSAEPPLLTEVHKEREENGAQKVEDDRAILALATRLSDAIERNGSSRPSISATWLKDLNELIVNDGHASTEVELVIDWCQRDQFWRQLILAPAKLRKHYDRLRLAAFPNGSRLSTSEEVDNEAIIRAYHEEAVAPPKEKLAAIKAGLLAATVIPPVTRVLESDMAS